MDKRKIIIDIGNRLAYVIITLTITTLFIVYSIFKVGTKIKLPF